MISSNALTIAEVAELFGVDRDRIESWIRRRRIRVFRWGRVVRIHPVIVQKRLAALGLIGREAAQRRADAITLADHETRRTDAPSQESRSNMRMRAMSRNRMQTHEDAEPYLDDHAASVYVGVALRTWVEWATSEVLPVCTLPNGRRRYRRSDIDALMRSGWQRPSSDPVSDDTESQPASRTEAAPSEAVQHQIGINTAADLPADDRQEDLAADAASSPEVEP